MPGVSSGQAIALAQQLAAKDLPPGMSYEWTDLAYQQIDAGDAALFVHILQIFSQKLLTEALGLHVPLGFVAAMRRRGLTTSPIRSAFCSPVEHCAAAIEVDP